MSMARRSPKLSDRILKAMADGADTSTEIAEMLGHPIASISAILSQLDQDGLVRKTGRWKMKDGQRGGSRSLCRELVTRR